ncbi:MAG: polyphosphate kinase 1 [Gammaproteobacteria bacterium]|nr:polyphosphate kinase 1 [Gammaproteobacteria bacterium]
MGIIQSLPFRHDISHELSALAFHRRVLHQATDAAMPLLERLRFLCIAADNLDGFLETRLGWLRQRARTNLATADDGGLAPAELLHEVGQRSRELLGEQHHLLDEELLPALRTAGIRRLRPADWSAGQRDRLHACFSRELAPRLLLHPLDAASALQRLPGRGVHFIVDPGEARGPEPAGRPIIIQVPRDLPFLIHPAAGASDSGAGDFACLPDVIETFVGELIAGATTGNCHRFRLIRNSSLHGTGADMGLPPAITPRDPGQPGAAARLELAHGCPAALGALLLERLELEPADLCPLEKPREFGRFIALYELPGHPQLRYPPFTPGMPRQLAGGKDLLAAIQAGDILLHHPFESFGPVMDFIRRGSEDPGVEAIQLTLYRSGQRSPIIDSLVAAARAGKQVTVFVELRARDDEAENTRLGRRLQDAGAKVVYGIVGHKIHCKMALLARREGDALRHYVHLGTGNYHPGTARQYTDYGLLSADPVLAAEVHQAFLSLVRRQPPPPFRRLMQAPFTLHREMLALIGRETAIAAAGGRGRIIAKLNALDEPGIIRALYRASAAGVAIDLIVRGVCCLRPGIRGLSENIRVRSIIGRFLEHSRVYYFHAGGTGRLYLSSADWMERNFFRRVELCFSIEDAAVKRRLHEDLEAWLGDEREAWELQPDGSYLPPRPRDGESAVAAQTALLRRLGAGSPSAADC